MFGLLQDLIEVRVDGLRDSVILSFNVVPSADIKDSDSSRVVEVEHLAVLSETVKNDP